MVRLDTIFEVDARDDEDDVSDTPDQSSLKSKLEAFQDASPFFIGNKNDDFSFSAQIAENQEIREPECELDPCCTEVPQLGAMANLKIVKRSGRPHSGLVDTALKLQQQPQQQRARQDSPQQMGPAYIWISDLAADWSCYSGACSTMLEPLEPVFVSPLVSVREPSKNGDMHEDTVKKAKRKRKKSLIDKAASQHRKELEEAKCQPRQFQQKEICETVSACGSLRGTRMANGCDDTLIPFEIRLEL